MHDRSSSRKATGCLLGLRLANDWLVSKKIEPNENSTGGTFSDSYVVIKDQKQGFLKAFDFSTAFEPGQDTIAVLSALTSGYEHEREVLRICMEQRLSRVVVAIDHGYVQVPDFDQMSGKVYYLIFEMADGDIRSQVDQSLKFDTLWSMQALKDACLGLFQVHKQMIAHQDLKPSNVLIYKGQGFRIADFGRSSHKGRSVWYDRSAVAGDRNYAPLELLYGQVHPEFTIRRFGCDLYMLGNLAAFMFAGINMTSSILVRLAPQFHWNKWHGTYEQVLPYVLEAFTGVLQDLAGRIDPIVRDDIVPIIRELCNPDPARRGHPKGIGRYDQYSLERYVSKFNLLGQHVQIRRRVA